MIPLFQSRLSDLFDILNLPFSTPIASLPITTIPSIALDAHIPHLPFNKPNDRISNITSNPPSLKHNTLSVKNVFSSL